MALPTGMEPKHADALIIVTYVALGLSFVASFMPWATVLVFTVSGTQGDGVLTLILALIGSAFLLGWHIGKVHSKKLLLCATIATALAVIVFWYDLIHITRIAHDAAHSSNDLFHISASPGSGLYLGCLASVVAVILEVLLLRRPALRPHVAEVSSSVAPPPAAPLSGWQPDPWKRHELRYFDGAAWTEHVSNAGVQTVDTVP